MKSLHDVILQTAAWIVPPDGRAAWLCEWRSELWYVPPREASRFCLGAFRDAAWLRRNHHRDGALTQAVLVSPLACLASLAVVAALSMLIAALLPAPRVAGPGQHLRPAGLAEASLIMLLYAVALLPATRLAMGGAAAGPPIPWRYRLRGWAFLALKVVLLQPAMLCGFLVLVLIAHVVPVAPLFVGASWIFAYRWILADQHRRCPVCLRLMTDPVRIGAASRTLLDWYGAESMCARGHGLLQVSETPVGAAPAQWLALDSRV